MKENIKKFSSFELPKRVYDLEQKEVNPPLPEGTDRQVLGYDEEGKPIAITLQAKHISDQPQPPEFPLGVVVCNFELNLDNQLGFRQLSSEKIPFAIVMRDEDGNFEGQQIDGNSIQSVNSKTGQNIVLNNQDVGADPIGASTTALNNANDYTDASISNLKIGQAGGIPVLDMSGKLPAEMLNVSGLNFKGAWNPNTNIPSILDGTGTVGDFYKASQAGSHNSGNGSFTYVVGDWVIYAGGTWQRIGSADTVTMVNGKLGNVVLTAQDVGALPNTYTAPVQSVNGKTGAVVINISDINNLQSSLGNKQETLISGNTIKTVGGISILGSGDIPFPISPIIAFSATRNTARTITGTSPLGCNKIDYSVGGGYNNTGDISTFTAPISGLYRFDASVYFGASNITEGWVGINVTSALANTQNGEYKFNNITGSGRIYTLTGGVEIRLQAGDTVQARAYTNASVNIFSTTATKFSGRLIVAL